MPKDIDIRGVLDTNWNLPAMTGLSPGGELKNPRRDALQDFENQMAAMQNRVPRKVVVYSGKVLPPPVPGSGEEVFYVKDKVLKSKETNLPYSLAAEMISDQFRPEKWSKLSTDAKIKSIELLEQSMGLQQTLRGAAKPEDTRPRSVEAITGVDLPPFKFSAGSKKIQIDKNALENPGNSSLGLDILDAMAIQQITSRKWNRHTPETRLSNLQLVEYGMAARQGRAARRVVPETLGDNEFGYYNDEEPYRLTISRKYLKAEINMKFTAASLSSRESKMFPNLETLDTVLHEGRHATQYDLTKGYMDPAFIGQKPEVKEAWKTNMTGYITGDLHPFSAYRYQPIEADANDFAREMIFNHMSGELSHDPTYTEYLNIKRKEHELDSGRAFIALGTNYLDKCAEITRQEEEALNGRIREAAPKQPGPVTDRMLTEFAAKMALPGISMATLSNNTALKSTEQYKSAADILENTLLSDEEKKLSGDNKEVKLNERLKQLHFGGRSFEEIYTGQKKSGWKDGSEVIYAAALMTEVMNGKTMVSPEAQKPQTATLKTGSFYNAVLKQEIPGDGFLPCNEMSKRQAVADGFRDAAARTGQPFVNKEEGTPYGFAVDGQMSKEQLSVARGLLLYQGYKLSDILDPNKLQYAKEVVGKSVSPIETQAKMEAMTAYMRFNIHNEIGHMNRGLHTSGDYLAEFADIRYQPQMLRVMSEFSGSFRTVHDLLKKDRDKKAKAYLAVYDIDIANTEKLESLLQPDRIKALYDYYGSQEYLEGRPGASGVLDRAAEASFVVQETVVRYGKKDACIQPHDLSTLMSRRQTGTAVKAVRAMDNDRKAQYIQNNERIMEALGNFTTAENAKTAVQQVADATAKQLVQALPPTSKTSFQELLNEEQLQQGKAEVKSTTKSEPVKAVHMDKKPVSTVHKP